MPFFQDLAGQTFGQLTVLRRDTTRPRSRDALWLVRCTCGTETIVRSNRLRSGKQVSCGCHRNHGQSQTAMYKAWTGMIGRCTNPKHRAYKNYGARGIRVATRWRHSFEAFVEDMGPRPPGMTIERKDNDGHYEPDNCRWASRAEQALNTRRNRLLTVNGITLPLKAWAERLGLQYGTLRTRLRRGWSISRAVTEPPMR